MGYCSIDMSFMQRIVVIFMMYCWDCQISNAILTMFKNIPSCRMFDGVLSKFKEICCRILGSNLLVLEVGIDTNCALIFVY